MKQARKKAIAAAVLGFFSLGLLAGCGGGGQQADGQDAEDENKTYNVGIVQLVTHASLDESNRGIIDGFAAEGLVAGENLIIDQQNALGDQANLQTITQRFISNRVDLVCAIATPAAQVMASATEEIPIIGTSITDFQSADLVESNEAPGTNVTGTNDMTPIQEQMDLLLQVVPDAKVIGTIYTSSEVNSQVQIEMLKEYAAAHDLQIEEATITNVNDIQQAAQSIVDKVDAIYLVTDNNIASAMPQVVGITDEAGLVTVCGATSMVEDGGTLTKGISFYQIGYEAGIMAAKILKGEAEPATMPVQSPNPEDLELIINMDAVNAIGIEIPADILANARQVSNTDEENAADGQPANDAQEPAAAE